MKRAFRYIQLAFHADPADKSILFNLALIQQQSTTVLNDQSLENRSLVALRQSLENLQTSAKNFQFLGEQKQDAFFGYDIKRAQERSVYCSSVRKVTEKKIHETEVLQRQREERLAEIKLKKAKDLEEKLAREVSFFNFEISKGRRRKA